jgi:hypothetical protein
MARIKYTGPINPLQIPGVGPVGKGWVPCPDEIAREFEKEDGFQVEFENSKPTAATKTRRHEEKR